MDYNVILKSLERNDPDWEFKSYGELYHPTYEIGVRVIRGKPEFRISFRRYPDDRPIYPSCPQDLYEKMYFEFERYIILNYKKSPAPKLTYRYLRGASIVSIVLELLNDTARWRCTDSKLKDRCIEHMPTGIMILNQGTRWRDLFSGFWALWAPFEYRFKFKEKVAIQSRLKPVLKIARKGLLANV